jgi:hypothetical protein
MGCKIFEWELKHPLNFACHCLLETTMTMSDELPSTSNFHLCKASFSSYHILFDLRTVGR